MISAMIRHVQEFFEISRKEARATLVLVTITFVLLWTPFIFRRLILPHFPVKTEKYDTARLDSLAAQIDKAAKETNYRYAENNGRRTSSPQVKVRLFRFDPNEASTEEFTKLGIPAFLAKRIDKYRSKGGKFRRKEDLLRIYDFPADLYKKLEPYVFLKETFPSAPRSGFVTTTKPYVPASTSPSQEGRFSQRFRARPPLSAFDINKADTSQLIKLRGIGSKLSLRIVKFRDALGGFHSATQFNEIYGLDTLAVSELQKYARVVTAVQKININTATASELGTHPYLKNKRIVQTIVNYREQHGPYANIEDLKKVKVLDDATISRIAPYLAF